MDAQQIAEITEKAFDYRGDVTLDLNDGSSVEGFLFNREFKASDPFVELYLPDKPEPVRYALKDVKDIRITGADMAAGKSWDDWMAKREREKQKTLAKLAAEGKELPHDHRDLKVF
ncbi:hypothetical protein QQ054_16090 [Oscillatoria amoena NRMC-F 0135]|nr:hypothetical protein [Oscillatoria laete-virens]MDL5047537.1 hypothetical protein [Oscillatoria amoena NRMC-F 0135]MDL5054641.1 hypothetical protein [Oscillatoria laete-virens NRMC-F 0139]